MNAPPQGPPGPHCPNCGYTAIGNLDRCPNCGFRLKKKFGGCRLIAAILVLVVFTILGAGFLLLADCAAGMSNGSGATANQQELNRWTMGVGAVEILLVSWLIYEFVRLARRK